MKKLCDFSKIYVFSPSNAPTGGVELLHQLVDYLRKRNKDAYIYYYDNPQLGVLAAYTLGEELDCSWDNTVYWNDFSSDAYVNDLLESPAIVRAVALYHAKRPDLANLEISSIYSSLY